MRVACLLCAGLLALPAAPLVAQSRHADPLSPGEIDQVRELGDRPVDRIKLLLRFTDQRVSAIHELTPDSKENDRPEQLRLRFDEFSRLADELGDNMDTYDKDHADIRKALRVVVAACAQWPDVLRSPLPDAAYDLERRAALAAAQDTAEDAKSLLAAEETYFAAHKSEAGKNGRAPTPEP